MILAAASLVLVVVAAEPATTEPATRVLVAPISATGLSQAVADTSLEQLLERLRGGGARVTTDALITPECRAEASCAQQAAQKANAHGLVTVSVLRVGPTVQITVQAIAAANGDRVVDEAFTAPAKGFPTRGTFDRVAALLVERLAPPATAVELTAMPAAAGPTAVSTATPATAGPSKLGLWLGLGASTTFVLGGTLMLLVARAEISRVEGARQGSSWRDFEAAYSRAPLLSGAGWAMVGLGVAGGVASLLWLPLGDDAKLSVGAVDAGATVVVSGRF